MTYWLIKSEPHVWSWEDQVEKQVTFWDGVRNYQASNNLKAMKIGDLAFFYHSGKEKTIMGIVEIVKSYYPDSSDPSGRFGMVDVKAVRSFADPVSLKKIIDLFKVKKEDALKAVESIKQEFNEKSSHGVYLSVNDNGISFKTKPEYFDVISGSLEVKPIKFTGPQLETLSIIAYKQPVTKNEIDAVRGFDSSSTLKFLLEKNLIKVAGRKEIVGRPLIYKTGDYFLEVFNLKNLNDLPSVKEMDDFAKKSVLEALNGSDSDIKTKETSEEPALFE